MPEPIVIAGAATAAAIGAAALAASRKSQAQRDQALINAGKTPYVVDLGRFGRGIEPNRRARVTDPATGEYVRDPATGQILTVLTPHWGIDITSPLGTNVHALKNGTVIGVGPRSGYGNSVLIQHDEGGESSLYAHLSEILAREGQRVRGGDIVGKVGNTSAGPDGRVPAWGRTMGVHLHMEVHPTPTPILTRTARRLNPVSWLRQQGIRQFNEELPR